MSRIPFSHPEYRSNEGKLTPLEQGPVTDYGATVVHWMRHRQPKYRGSFRGEVERPSASYIVDVSALPLPGPAMRETNVPCSCCLPAPEWRHRQIPSPLAIFILR